MLFVIRICAYGYGSSVTAEVEDYLLDPEIYPLFRTLAVFHRYFHNMPASLTKVLLKYAAELRQ